MFSPAYTSGVCLCSSILGKLTYAAEKTRYERRSWTVHNSISVPEHVALLYLWAPPKTSLSPFQKSWPRCTDLPLSFRTFGLTVDLSLPVLEQVIIILTCISNKHQCYARLTVTIVWQRVSTSPTLFQNIWPHSTHLLCSRTSGHTVQYTSSTLSQNIWPHCTHLLLCSRTSGLTVHIYYVPEHLATLYTSPTPFQNIWPTVHISYSVPEHLASW